MTVCGVDYGKCRRCQNGARPNRYHPSGKPDRLAALCVRTCVDALERALKLDTIFASEFQQREPWALDAAGQPVQVDLGAAKKTRCADPEGFRALDGET
jgi:hypothetical protein